MVFASNEGIEVLKRAKTISIDGTFTSCPPPFIQVFIIMASLPSGGNVPCVYALLPNKLSSTYSQLFGIVKNLAEDMFTGTILHNSF
jgi:hypothetical protein